MDDSWVLDMYLANQPLGACVEITNDSCQIKAHIIQ